MLLLFTEMRRGKMVGLKWEDVDWEKNVFHIDRSIPFPRSKNNCVIGKSKTEIGLLAMPIFPELMMCCFPGHQSLNFFA